MRLLIVTSYLPSPTDGASTSGRALVEELKKRDVDCMVCTSDLAWPRNLIPSARSEGIEIFHAWFSMILEFSPEMLFYFINKMRYFDLIHFGSFFSFRTIFGTFVAKLLKKPYVVCPQGDYIPHWKNRKTITRGALKYLLFHLFIKRSLLKADCLICTSDLEYHRMAEILNKNDFPYVIIPNGIKAEIYRETIDCSIIEQKIGIPANKKIILYLGRITQEKALDFLIDVWETILAQNVRDHVLVIAGSEIFSTGYSGSIKTRLSCLTHPESVLMPGSVTGKVKSALLQHSRCLVLPSYRECFGNVVLEALASGTPVIASTGTPWQSLESEHLGRWLPHDKEAWARAIIETTEISDSQKQEFTEKSRQWVEKHFNWDFVASKYIETYAKCIS
jgi:glycosyltransferase involved in cell wall biosynthesis